MNTAGKRRSRRPTGDLNITPLIDVMLVLLVIFMVSAPLINVSIPVCLPKVSASGNEIKDQVFTITFDKSGSIFLQNQKAPIDIKILPAILAENASKSSSVFIRADKTIPYGKVMDIVGLCTKAGIQKVSFVVETL